MVDGNALARAIFAAPGITAHSCMRRTHIASATTYGARAGRHKRRMLPDVASVGGMFSGRRSATSGQRQKQKTPRKRLNSISLSRLCAIRRDRFVWIAPRLRCARHRYHSFPARGGGVACGGFLGVCRW
jgi:hypothetical protein